MFNDSINADDDGIDGLNKIQRSIGITDSDQFNLEEESSFEKEGGAEDTAYFHNDGRQVLFDVENQFGNDSFAPRPDSRHRPQQDPEELDCILQDNALFQRK